MDRLRVIEEQAERFAAVLGSADPDARVPTCPDWNAADLLWHLTEVHLFWGGILASAAQTDQQVGAVDEAKPDRPEAIAELLTLRERATGELLDQLRRLDDDVPRWSWWPADQTVGFTRRMQTYEATMHRIDAELTAGIAVGPIAPDVAAGAIDHCADVMWAWLPTGASYTPRALVELDASDTDDHWLVEIGNWSGTYPGQDAPADGIRAVRAGAGQPSAHVTGPVDDLARWAWTRGGTVEITGDPDAVEAVRALHDAGIQ